MTVNQRPRIHKAVGYEQEHGAADVRSKWSMYPSSTGGGGGGGGVGVMGTPGPSLATPLKRCDD